MTNEELYEKIVDLKSQLGDLENELYIASKVKVKPIADLITTRHYDTYKKAYLAISEIRSKLFSAFSWGSSPAGYEYWEKVNENLITIQESFEEAAKYE